MKTLSIFTYLGPLSFGEILILCAFVAVAGLVFWWLVGLIRKAK